MSTILWNKDTELQFFKKASENFATIDQLFYRTEGNEYYAYWPKTYKGKKTTLQSRNSLIGAYTENWCQRLLEELAEPFGYYSVASITCPEIGLPSNSKGDLALCKTNRTNPDPEDVLLLFEVKMSLTWNWYLPNPDDINSIECAGDFTTHKGNPSILRSDSMLKAIGKSIDIKVSSHKSARIPIVVLGNTPISKNYIHKVDQLRKHGIIHGFWSLNPQPLDDASKNDKLNFKSSDGEAFFRVDTMEELVEHVSGILEKEREFFASTRTMPELGRIIEVANSESTYEAKAERFLSLIRGE